MALMSLQGDAQNLPEKLSDQTLICLRPRGTRRLYLTFLAGLVKAGHGELGDPNTPGCASLGVTRILSPSKTPGSVSTGCARYSRRHSADCIMKTPFLSVNICILRGPRMALIVYKPLIRNHLETPSPPPAAIFSCLVIYFRVAFFFLKYGK